MSYFSAMHASLRLNCNPTPCKSLAASQGLRICPLSVYEREPLQ